MEFMKAFDKVCLNIPKVHMNKYRQVTQVIGLFSNQLKHCICNVLSNGFSINQVDMIAWKIPWTEEPGRFQSMGSRRIRHDSVT